MKQRVDLSNVDWTKGCTTAFINGLFVFAALLLFSKTADLFAQFAPSNLFGYTGVGIYYGMAVAAIVEGVFIVAKFMLPSAKNPIAWIFNLVLIGLTFTISMVAQAVDSLVISQQLATQPESVQLAVTWLVPAVPAMVVGLLLVLAVLESVPLDFLPKKDASPNDNRRSGQP